MRDITYEGRAEIGYVSQRERRRNELTLRMHALANELHTLDLQGARETTGKDGSRMLVTSLRREIDGLKTELAALDATEPGDFVCSNRMCNAIVDMDDPATEYAVADLPRLALYQGRLPEGNVWFGYHPALALGFCGACREHFLALAEERAPRGDQP
jgi:hypothetical protein